VKARTRPRFTGWLSRANPFAFDIDAVDLRDDGMAMMNGTPAIPAYYAALPGLEIIQQVGVDRIRAASQAMTARLLERVDDLGYPSIAPRDPDRLAGTVAVDVPEAMRVAKTLNARDFVVDFRPGVGVRLSPHFYNTLDEIDAMMHEIDRITRSKDYTPGA
jgi:kynureninase